MNQRYYLFCFLLVLVILACGQGGPSAEEPLIVNQLPTLTPTSQASGLAAAPQTPTSQAGEPAAAPQAEAAPAAGETATDASPLAPAEPAPGPVPVAQAGSPPASSTTAVSETPGWSFVRAQLYPDTENSSLVLYTEMVNETGVDQLVIFPSGNFYDAQGELLADSSTIDSYWPVETVPPGGRMPLELRVNGLQEANNYTLYIQAEPSPSPPRQDFEVSDVTAANTGDAYCIKGKVRNPGDPLQEYLVILYSLYNSQGNLVTFSHQFDPNFLTVVGDQTSPFEVCIGAANLQEVADYSIQVWGR